MQSLVYIAHRAAGGKGGVGALAIQLLQSKPSLSGPVVRARWVAARCSDQPTLRQRDDVRGCTCVALGVVPYASFCCRRSVGERRKKMRCVPAQPLRPLFSREQCASSPACRCFALGRGVESVRAGGTLEPHSTNVCPESLPCGMRQKTNCTKIVKIVMCVIIDIIKC